MGRPAGSQNKDKPYRDALRMEAVLAESGDPTPALPGSLRWIARKQLERAGEDTSAAKEIADRLDGKVPTPVVGGDEDDNPLSIIQKIECIIVDPPNSGGESV